MPKLKKILCLLLLCLSTAAIAQEIHHQDAKSVEELLYKKDPAQARSLFSKDKYLVLEKVRSGKRKKFYKGDVFRFTTKDNISYEDDLFSISDSSFVITTFNEVMNRYEYVEIKLSEVKSIYKYPKKRINFGIANFSPFAYLLIEWAAWGVDPITNPKLPLAAGLTAVSPLFTILQNSLRSKKLTENYRLRVFQSF
ncbi:hypothetical protein [Emticicia sp. 21SJ11W-3]|uniref:hypothetical protein n=1 Tax=Emticicia sp. 21SJ11W-3 TaxID=2916755 RepID=UPI0020A193EE|nr:hypothetical protein [Emticicia sp. 21SJ11W-3]UTA69953.1 hypothetical protein MB380_09070 [Emticicia sp. 21SJ11W-3]